MNSTGEFLLSIDLEDVRDSALDGHRLSERVPVMTARVLALLRVAGAKITFFVTGPVAKRYPTLLRVILREGHELACHTCAHKPLEKYAEPEFEKDLAENIELLTAAGATAVEGFRAPILSVTSQTAWVYEVLRKHGLRYSSSVLPARNPLYGWPEFGQTAKLVGGVVEIPVSVARVWGMLLPFASGVYFRVIPYPIVRRRFRAAVSRGNPVVCYMHPYDFDQDQEPIMPRGINNNPLYKFLMYYNRAGALAKLRKLMAEGFRVSTYREFALRASASETFQTATHFPSLPTNGGPRRMS